MKKHQAFAIAVHFRSEYMRKHTEHADMVKRGAYNEECTRKELADVHAIFRAAGVKVPAPTTPFDPALVQAMRDAECAKSAKWLEEYNAKQKADLEAKVQARLEEKLAECECPEDKVEATPTDDDVPAF